MFTNFCLNFSDFPNIAKVEMKTKTLAGDDCVYTVPIQSDKHTLAILSEERENGDVVFESEFSLLPFQAFSFSPF